MRKDFYVYILMPTRNNLNLLDVTVESILRQTYTTQRIKIVFLDNASTDGTYEKELSYIAQNPQIFSVIRESMATTDGRLLKKAIAVLRYSEISFSMLILPGDIIYEDCLEREILLLTLNKGARLLVSETDLSDEQGSTVSQEPIFSDNCELRAEFDRIQYYRTGIGHKVQILFRGLCLSTAYKLPYYAQVAEFNEWFSARFFYDNTCIYVRNPSGCVYMHKETDPIAKLINRTFFMKRTFYAVETNVFSTLVAGDILHEEIAAGYRGIATMAIQYALEQIRMNQRDIAADCLIYAEMMDLEITKEETYQIAMQALQDKTKVDMLEKALIQKSVAPPRECALF